MPCSTCQDCETRVAKKKLANFKSNLRQKYGITVEQFNNLLAQQQGVCAICKKPEIDNKRLSVDHCHKTKTIRGLLCSACNGGLGLFKDDCYSLQQAIEYVRKHQVQ